MNAAHAQAALENQEGALRAIADFKQGIDANPFDKSEGWRPAAYDAQMRSLIQKRDCREAGHELCCWEHDQHVQRWNKSQWGIKSCPNCLDAAEIERATRAAVSTSTEIEGNHE